MVRGRGIAVVGSNLSRPLRSTISAGGQAAMDGLSAEQRAWVPETLYANSPEYWKRFYRAVSGHMGSADRDVDPESMIYSVQSLWDNTMGFSCARALDRYPGHAVLHINGGFHTKYGQGTAQQLKRRKPDARVATIQVLPTSDLFNLDLRSAGRAADYLVFVTPRGRGPQQT